MNPIIIRLHGGLGNQLFQLLAARYLAIEKGVPIEVYISDLNLFSTKRDFEIKPLLKDETVVNSISFFDKVLFKYKISKVLSNIGIHSISNVSDLPRWKGQYLNGYFQDVYLYQNKDGVGDMVRSIEKSLSALTDNSSIQQSIDYSSTCAIHLRLTDFVYNRQGEKFLNTYRIPYILKSVEYFKKEHQIEKFMVFTDDLLLAKKLLPNKELLFFGDVVSDRVSLLEEFNTISSFKYLITSNSTFSFWSSVIGGRKTIVFPALWKHDDKKEDLIFKRNIELHSEIFAKGNYIKVMHL